MKTKRKETVPTELASTLQQDAAARRAFGAMPPSHQARYSEWINEARKPETRARRAAKSLAMMKEWLAAKA